MRWNGSSQKKDREGSNCADLKRLNQSVLREVHPIPRVDEVLAQLSGAAVFSKLDANSGFWQIPLSSESRPSTTFLMPFGWYWFFFCTGSISKQNEYSFKWSGRSDMPD